MMRGYKDSDGRISIYEINGALPGTLYGFGRFVFHSVIAGITGLIGGIALDSIIIGVIIGIVSFVLCTAIHFIISGNIKHADFYMKDTIEKIKRYIITLVAAFGLPVVYFMLLPSIVAGILTIITLIAAFKIAMKKH